MGITEFGRVAVLALVMATVAACSSVGEPGKSAAMDAYRAAHPGAGNVEVQRTIALADCDYIEVSGEAGLQKMTVSRDSRPRVLQTAATEGPGYFDSDYGGRRTQQALHRVLTIAGERALVPLPAHGESVESASGRDA